MRWGVGARRRRIARRPASASTPVPSGAIPVGSGTKASVNFENPGRYKPLLLRISTGVTSCNAPPVCATDEENDEGPWIHPVSYTTPVPPSTVSTLKAAVYTVHGCAAIETRTIP
jgi:hypothetical protein